MRSPTQLVHIPSEAQVCKQQFQHLSRQKLISGNLGAVIRLASATIDTVRAWRTAISPDQRATRAAALEQRLVDLVNSRIMAIVPGALKTFALDLGVGPTLSKVSAPKRYSRGLERDCENLPRDFFKVDPQ